MSKKIKTTNHIENTLVGSISNQLKNEEEISDFWKLSSTEIQELV